MGECVWGGGGRRGGGVGRLIEGGGVGRPDGKNLQGPVVRNPVNLIQD